MVRDFNNGVGLIRRHPGVRAARGHPGRRRPRCPSLGLETLEGRILLSGNPTIYTVNSVGNSDAGSGTSGTLPYVIGQANADANPAGSLIEFDPTVFAAPQTITLAGTLELTEAAGPEVINGPGASLVTVSGNNAVEVFNVGSGVTATLSSLTVSGGSATNGGGIDNLGTLMLSDNVINNCYASNDGGGIDNTGTMTVTNSTISSNNSTAFSTGSRGGGIENTGTLTLTNSTIAGNSANGGDGGGGIANSGTFSITDCTFSGNSAFGGGGGGIYNTGTLSVADCTFSGNSASGGVVVVGGIGGSGNGGGIDNGGTLAITDCTFSGNSASGGRSYFDGVGGSGNGGGIDNGGGTLAISDSTFSANSASGGDGSYGGGGGGFYGSGGGAGNGGGISDSGTLAISDSTFSGNSASGGVGVGGVGAGNGGGIAILGTGNPKVTTINSIFQNTQGGNVSFDLGVTFHSLGHNLFSDAPSFGLDSTDLIDTDPLLGPLADHGGPTLTMALLPGSPAIDAGMSLADVTTDQRGIPRSQGSAPDIGAFESRGFTLTIVGGDDQSTPPDSPFPVPLVVSISSPFGEPVAGGRITFEAPTIGASATFTGNPVTIGSDGQASVDAVANGLGGSYLVTAQAAGAPSVAFALTNDLPPTVMDLRPVHVPGRPTTIILTFSDPMAVSPAQDSANYRLVWAGRGERPGALPEHVIPIRRARYDAATESVTLRLVRPLPSNRTYTLTVNGTSAGALTSASGMALDGAGMGRPGNDAVVRFRRQMLPNPARIELVGNGGFEPVKVHLRDKARTILPGRNGLAPWRVTAGSVDVQTYWPAVQGEDSVDLNGVAAGTIRQTFATIPGQAYQLSFCYANNPDGPAHAATAVVSLTGASPRLNWKLTHAGSTSTDMNYSRFLGTFVADSATTTLQFASTTPGAYGIVLSAVSVTALETTPSA